MLDREFGTAWRELTAAREQAEVRRAAWAEVAATELVADFVRVVADQPDVDVEDALCLRLGTLLGEAARLPVDEDVQPRHIADAVVKAAVAGGADASRVLTAVAGVLPNPYGAAAAAGIARNAVGRRVPPGPRVSGPVLWTRDRYGSRFGVVTPIARADGSERWYLWDLDACGHEVCTVHSRFHPTPEAAVADWRDGVGEIAAAGTEFVPVDDPWLLSQLMAVDPGMHDHGGESEAQFAEFFRARRLAELVKQAVARRGRPPARGVDVATAAAEFAAWLRARGTHEASDDLDELAWELADSWCVYDLDALFTACSPHRVALFVPFVRDYYGEDYAGELVALLPEWTRWLAERNATPPELAERCVPYAHGLQHPQLGVGEPDYYARVVE
ncbi:MULTISPECIES: hypothetical protein [unclassified Saccharothrix]|uniref:hypothetical protein n=1 Tax=unclassified Saccharothrix TaxID=2593673 RepID=UPI00307FCC01